MCRLLFLFIFSLGFVACSNSSKPLIIDGKTMGTTYHIKYFQSEVELNRKELKNSVDALLVSVNQSMSTYIKSSEISTFNKSRQMTWQKASKEILFVTNRALEIGHKTGGSYDPTLGPLVNLWGFGPNGKREVPEASAIAKARESVGLSLLSVDVEKGQWKKNHPNVYVDLSSLAKGYGVDEVALLLGRSGAKNYMVEIGGEVRTSGSKNGAPWKIAIESPDIENPKAIYPKILNLNNAALATSGNYRNFFTQNKKNYSHTIDFKTGRPVAHTLASVSVANTDSCMNADAWATALMSLGFEKGYKLAQELKLAAYFIYKLDNNKHFVSKGTDEFNKLFK
ncbi:thiamine biosynthesis lipoprotein [Halobacteriovorax marinus SJ]|uniref:FAD:protein FMN transferase n=1 Tax=Halobacteriovorax marinus (strain ATCC BAA-682 / DSM 15412 / SJ) TaxID=862908 RepID=E1X490_HALMS|nr:FAD:protein FMN transferase [Halobacteriovorax marinus]CBW27062.1 thiamine biosynthesis lipoprotein [Halobacteriovorax marinus SJ]